MYSMAMDSDDLSSAWTKWHQAFELYLDTSGYSEETDKKKVTQLLFYMGPRGLEIFNSFKMDRAKVKYNEIVTRFNEYFSPKKHLTWNVTSFSQGSKVQKIQMVL